MDIRTHVYRLQEQDGTFIELSEEVVKERDILVLGNLSDSEREIAKELEEIINTKGTEKVLEFLTCKIDQFKLEFSLKKGELVLMPRDQLNLINSIEKRLDLSDDKMVDIRLNKSMDNKILINLDLLKKPRGSIIRSWRKLAELNKFSLSKEDEEYVLYRLTPEGELKRISDEELKGLEGVKVNSGLTDDEGDKEDIQINSTLTDDAEGTVNDKDVKDLGNVETNISSVDETKQRWSRVLDIQIKEKIVELKKLNHQVKEREIELEGTEVVDSGNVEVSQEKKLEEESEIRVEEDFTNSDQSMSKPTGFSKKKKGWFKTLISCIRSILTFLVYCFVLATVMFFYFPEIIDPWLAKLNAKLRLLGWKVRWPRVKRGRIRNERIIIWFERN